MIELNHFLVHNISSFIDCGGQLYNLLITLHYYPEENFITTDLANALNLAGHKMFVLTTFPNYPMGKFKKYTNYFFPKFEDLNGVSVLRVPFFPSRKKSKMLRMLSYLSFVFSALICIPYLLAKGVPKRTIVYQTPFFTAIPALVLKMLGSKLIYISADLWPESLLATNVCSKGNLMELMFWYSRWVNRFADLILASTKGTSLRYISDGIDEKKIKFIPIWVDGIDVNYENVPKNEELPLPRIVYAGNIGPAQGLEVLLNAARILQERFVQVELYFFGIGLDLQSLKVKASTDGIKNCYFCGRVTPSEAFRHIRNATANLIHLVPSEYFRMTIPSKISSALAAGTPILSGVSGEVEELLRNQPGVFQFRSNDAEGLAEAIIRVINLKPDELSQAKLCNVQLYKKSFDRSELLKKYVNEILEVGVGYV